MPGRNKNGTEGKKGPGLGAGISGIGAARLLLDASAEVILYDGNEDLSEADIRNRLPEDQGLTVILGSLEREIIDTLRTLGLKSRRADRPSGCGGV